MNATLELQSLTAKIEYLKTQRDKVRAGIAAAAPFQPGDFVKLIDGEGNSHTAYIYRVLVSNEAKVDYTVKSSPTSLFERAVMRWYKIEKI